MYVNHHLLVNLWFSSHKALWSQTFVVKVRSPFAGEFWYICIKNSECILRLTNIACIYIAGIKSWGGSEAWTEGVALGGTMCILHAYPFPIYASSAAYVHLTANLCSLKFNQKIFCLNWYLFLYLRTGYQTFNFSHIYCNFCHVSPCCAPPNKMASESVFPIRGQASEYIIGPHDWLLAYVPGPVLTYNYSNYCWGIFVWGVDYIDIICKKDPAYYYY